MQLTGAFFVVAPHGAQPVEVYIRILKNQKVGQGVAVVAYGRGVVGAPVGKTAAGTQAQNVRHLVIGGHRNGHAFEAGIGQNPLVFGVGKRSPDGALVALSLNGHIVDEVVAGLKQGLAIIGIAHPGRGLGALCLCYRVELVIQLLGVEAGTKGTAGAAGAAVQVVGRAAVRIVQFAFVFRSGHANGVGLHTLPKFVLVVGPAQHIVHTQVGIETDADAFLLTIALLGGDHDDA